MELPESKRGNAWFWARMREGENGVQFAKRLPPTPEWVKPDQVVIWTKVSSGREAWHVLLVRTIEGVTMTSLYQ